MFYGLMLVFLAGCVQVALRSKLKKIDVKSGELQ